MLGSRALLPPFDARYRGYGRDKVSFTRLLDHSGFRYAAAALPWELNQIVHANGS